MTHQQTDTSPPEQPLTTADYQAGITRELATLRRYWPGTVDPPVSGGGTSTNGPESKFPGNDTAISLRAEVTRDLAFWCHAAIDGLAETGGTRRPEVVPDASARVRVPLPMTTVHTVWTWATVTRPGTLDCTDVPAMAAFLTGHAAWLSGWTHRDRLWDELITLARDVRDLAAPRVRDTMALGECPECGTVVRAKAANPGEIKCSGCAIVDTIDGWIIRVVGNEPMVTATQLVPILHKRMGIVATTSTIGTWLARGTIHASGSDERGRALFDRKAVFAALALGEAARSARAERVAT